MCDANAMDSMDRAVARCLSQSGIVSQYHNISSDSPIILVFYEQNQLPQIWWCHPKCGWKIQVVVKKTITICAKYDGDGDDDI